MSETTKKFIEGLGWKITDHSWDIANAIHCQNQYERLS